MYRFKKILAALDFSDADTAILEFLSSLKKSVEMEKIYFLHVSKGAKIPPDILEKFPNLAADDEATKNAIKEKLQKELRESELNYELEVVQGDILEQIIRRSHEKEIDLIVLGMKKKHRSEALLSRVLKLSHCSIAMIPEGRRQFSDLKTIITPLDFSKYSQMAIETAIEIARSHDAKLIAHHIYTVPSGYHTTGKSYKEFGNLMEENAQKEFDQFIQKIDVKGIKFSSRFALDKERSIGRKIIKFAREKNADLLVIGSKGRTAAASFIFGSVSEKALHHNQDIPMIIVKDKAENMGFLKAILKL